VNAWTIHESHRRLLAKEISAVELTKQIIQHKEKVEQDIHAYLHDTQERALATAQKVDDKIAAGETIAPLAGVPGALKDNLCSDGEPVSAASKILEHFIAPYNATVV